jgi:hypothetical protein
VRGDIYFVADGSYGALTLNTPASGTAAVTIRKATSANHGSDTGWVDTYGNAQATFGLLKFVTSYYVFDGQVRNDANWEDVASYGFRISEVYASAIDPGPICPDFLTFQYVDVGGSPIGNTYSSSNGDGFYMGGFGNSCDNWTISHSHIHNVKLAFQMAGAQNALIEYNHIGPAWSKEAIRGQDIARGHVIRHNTIKDACQMDPQQGSSSGCTAEIAMWGDTRAGYYDNVKIYGNIIQKTTTEDNSGGAIVIGGDGSSWVGTAANNVEVYNNTIVGMTNWTAVILINGGTGNIARNNLWSGLAAGVDSGAKANATSNNLTVSTSTFVAYPTDLRLKAPTSNGFTLPRPYNVDRTSRTRGSDGTWDIGAYEFAGSSTSPSPSAPTNVRIVQ